MLNESWVQQEGSCRRCSSTEPRRWIWTSGSSKNVFPSCPGLVKTCSHSCLFIYSFLLLIDLFSCSVVLSKGHESPLTNKANLISYRKQAYKAVMQRQMKGTYFSLTFFFFLHRSAASLVNGQFLPVFVQSFPILSSSPSACLDELCLPCLTLSLSL